jgi:hypothetical protein
MSTFASLYLFFQLLQSERLSLLFLLASQLPLFFIYTTGTSHVVLGLRQKILTLTSLQACQCDIITHAVPMDRQIVEVPAVMWKKVYQPLLTQNSD